MLLRNKKNNFMTLPLNKTLPTGKSCLRFRSKDGNIFNTTDAYKNVLDGGKGLPRNVFKEEELIEWIKTTPQFVKGLITIVKSKEEVDNELRAVAIAEFVKDQQESAETGFLNLNVLEKLELDQLQRYARKLGVSISAAEKDGVQSKERPAEDIVKDVTKLLKPETKAPKGGK